MEGFFAGESVPVNRKLSEIFLQLHISEKTGRGVPKITEKYGKDAFELERMLLLLRYRSIGLMLWVINWVIKAMIK